MNFLFKSTLSHLRKNSLIVSVLSFFVASGTAVVSSVDHLSFNLNKGFSEINFDSNPHDLVLISKTMKPSQKLNIIPKYFLGEWKDVKITPKWGYRWAWENINNSFWTKKTGASNFTIDNDRHFSFPKEGAADYSYMNVYLRCAHVDSFFNLPEKNLLFVDRNSSHFSPKEIIPGGVLKTNKQLKGKCPSNPVENLGDFSISLLKSILSYYRDYVVRRDNDASSSRVKSIFEETGKEEEIAKLHSDSKSLVPRRWLFFKETGEKSSENIIVYLPLVESDFYFDVELKFIAELSGQDISGQFKKLVDGMSESSVFYKLDDRTRNAINNFKSSDLFSNNILTYYLSSSAQFLSTWDVALPKVEGLSFWDMGALIYRLFIWHFLNQHEENARDKIMPYPKFEDDELEKNIKSSIKSIISEWNESATDGIDGWKGTEDFGELVQDKQPKDQDKRPDTSEKYVFSTVRAKKKISELNPSQKSQSSQIYSQEDTLISAVKKVFIKWIDEDESSNKSVPGKSVSKDQIATSFSDVYKKMYQEFNNRFFNYISLVITDNVRLARTFINENEIFTLSFLLNKFSYNHNAHQERLNLVSRENSENEEEEDLTLSVNYHKSLVVANSPSASAKLNDPTKTGHSFKVINQQRKNDAFVNRLKIVSGNPLFEEKQDIMAVFNNFVSRNIADKDSIASPSYAHKDFFKILSRMKYEDPAYEDVARSMSDYVSSKYDDPWVDENWVSLKASEAWKIWKQGYIRDDEFGFRLKGSRIFGNIKNLKVIHFARVTPEPVMSNIPGFVRTSYIDRFSSYFAVISPVYAQKNKITPISDEKYYQFKQIVEGNTATQQEFENAYYSFILDPTNYDHIINVNGNKLIVVGTGTSPDMVLPSHSLLSLIPNKEKEALVFVDDAGYDKIKYNSLSNWDEYYLSLSYPQIIKDLGKEAEFKKQLSDYIGTFLWGKEWNDDNDYVELVSAKHPNSRRLVFMRTNYVDNFLYSVNTLSSIILVAMTAIILFTLWILIKKYISSSLNTFGVFIANGVCRNQIIFSSMMFVIIPTVIGTVLGYLVSLAIQPLIFSLISEIWYLNPIFSGFSISSMLHYMIVALSILIPVSALSAYVLMRGNANQLMKSTQSLKNNKFVEWMYSFVQNASSLWKFRSSVILNTAGRGLVLSGATVFLFVFSSFLFNNLGQFAAISNYEKEIKEYGFSLSLETPTTQSGQPLLASYMNIGSSFEDPTTHKKTVITKGTDGKYKSEVIEFNSTNPEPVAKGITALFSPVQLKKWYETCNNQIQGIDKWREKLGLLDYDYLGSSFLENTYVEYVFGNKLQTKDQQTIDCNQNITQTLTRSDFKLPIPKVSEVWGSSIDIGTDQKTDSSTNGKKFTPDDSVDISDLGSYVPSENEKQSDKKQENYDSEPLFKPLIDYYQKQENQKQWYRKAQKTESDKTYNFASESGDSYKDFVTLQSGQSGQSGQEHPTLKRLIKDQANYWLLSYVDMLSTTEHPTYMKNKVLMPVLFDHTWTFEIYGQTISFNPWSEFSDFFSKYSPELVAAMNDNYAKFIQNILTSRYGAFFVKRFMTKHVGDATNNQNHPIGKEFQGRKTWYVSKSLLDSKNQDSKLDEPGLYYVDPAKIVYMYEKMKVGSGSSDNGKSQISDEHQDRFIIYRPDFLYLFYAIMKDKEFLKEHRPIKIAFHQNLYTPNYDDFTDEWRITGNVEEDTKVQKGLTSSDSTVTAQDYQKIPGGDQSYTYLDIQIPGISDTTKIQIFGLKQDKRGSFIKLNKKGTNINSLLYSQKGTDNAYPVIINHFTAKKLNLQAGSTFEVTVMNTVDRFEKKLREEEEGKKVTLRVEDIYDSYYNVSIYMSQKNANEILGLNPDYGYNGIFTKRVDGGRALPDQLKQVISTYSKSGIYAKTEIKKSSGSFIQFLKTRNNNLAWLNHAFNPPANHEFLNKKLGLSSGYEGVDNMASILDKTFANEDAFAISRSVIGIDNAALFNNFVFSTVSDLIISVVNLFIVIFTPLLVCSLLAITSLIIEDMKNLLTILNLLGFTHTENSITILLYLGLILSFSTIIALPLSHLVLNLYVNGVFNSLNMYLPIYLRFDYVMVSFASIFAMFAYSYWKCMRKIKSLYLPIAMKSLNE